MHKLTHADIVNYIETHIPSFHQRRLESLNNLKLQKILQKKNPYLFKAKNIHIAADLVKEICDAYLSSSEETIFGDFLEELAIFICNSVFEGRKSSAEGIDLEFEKEKTLYIVSIKSGPNWGNSSQIKKMQQNFRQAQKILGGSKKHIVAVNGCCYGREPTEEKEGYLKLCGQRFWSFISGDDNLYLKIIEPLGHRAKEHNDQFLQKYASVVNRFTDEFMQMFCKDGSILWEKLVRYNSGKESYKVQKIIDNLMQ